MNDINSNVIILKNKANIINKHNNYAKAAHHCFCAHQYYLKADELYHSNNIVQCHVIMHKADRHLKIADIYRSRANKFDHIFRPLEIIGLNDSSEQIDIV